ncbi:hypothetical protein EJ08DRAFT_659469 [Tothia fuscella]|uniref:Uncharacterized protein n=1 Tax=Tothia fuscella TaxID=1048955 RepID=A0A9P4NTX1_9PEZI|nr:hypothetical protein EJ08DRAFT_659469 [Tothia fuscella]
MSVNALLPSEEQILTKIRTYIRLHVLLTAVLIAFHFADMAIYFLRNTTEPRLNRYTNIWLPRRDDKIIRDIASPTSYFKTIKMLVTLNFGQLVVFEFESCLRKFLHDKFSGAALELFIAVYEAIVPPLLPYGVNLVVHNFTAGVLEYITLPWRHLKRAGYTIVIGTNGKLYYQSDIDGRLFELMK